ncbi:MAG: hypothetical protein K8U03_14550 [Planctomycetia bacterium]|nr:hypothetical protein [Planctomycetia bacterium]
MSTVPDRDKPDLKAVFDAVAEGKKPDPELVKRIRERSAARRRKFDYEISLELLRAAREE